MGNQLHTMPLRVERFLSSRRVRAMKLDELGAFLLLLMESWLEGGSLPADEAQDILGIEGADWERIKERVVNRMFTTLDGRLVNGTLSEIYAETLTRSQAYREAGIRGNEKRWADHRKAMAGQSPSDSQPVAPKAKDKPKAAFTPPTPAEVDSYCKAHNKPFVDAIAFCAFYASKGWKVGNQAMVSWHDATTTWNEKHKNDKGSNVRVAPGQHIPVSDEVDDFFNRKVKG